MLYVHSRPGGVDVEANACTSRGGGSIYTSLGTICKFVCIYCSLSFFASLLKLSFQRKFVRACDTRSDATYKTFREWLDGATPTEDEWKVVMDEDQLYNYNNTEEALPNIDSEVDVYTSSGGSGGEVTEDICDETNTE